ncbi:hypothetical protein L9F63_027362, partial [Diploptera punctata]
MNAVHFVSLLFCATNIILAFLTLLERKVLGYVHIRKGPNKVGFIGILQPFRDAIKLLNDNKPILSLPCHYSTTLIMNIQFFANLLSFLENGSKLHR